MIPQDRFVIVAKVPDHNVEGLRSLLRTMTFPEQTGFADPANSLVPFGEFETIHFARFAVLADNTLKDRVGYYPPSGFEEPTYLCFMADCDGDADELLARIARKADGLRKIFSYCEDFVETGDLLGWLRTHRVKPLASYVNWVGRTVVQAKEEARLHDLLRKALPEIDERDPQDILARLRQSVRPAVSLTPTPPTPLAWRIRDLAHMLLPLLVAAACFVLFPIPTIVLLAVGTLLFIIALRWHEQTDPIIPQPYDPEKVTRLRKGEDHDVTNQYTAMGSLKPGRFRLWTVLAITCLIGWIARHICTRGTLGRIGTIHSAHWVFIEQYRRGFFCTNYDGTHEAYMDDFINKVGFGLNLAFSGAVAYPTTDWLVAKGAWLEQDFKRYQRHHQIPTDVWYKAYPGLTARDLSRNSRIRNGFEKAVMNDDEIRRWLAEI
ncbi:hypothetical protein [Bradyrhizobium sp.]